MAKGHFLGPKKLKKYPLAKGHFWESEGPKITSSHPRVFEETLILQSVVTPSAFQNDKFQELRDLDDISSLEKTLPANV